MAQVVKLKRSAVAGKVPSTGSLELGELALNTYDGRVFFEKSGSNGESVEQIFTTNAEITGSLLLYKSGSTVVDIQGSQGQLFSITDSLSGSLMSVNDISGLPIFEVFSDDRVVMGEYGQNTLYVSASKVGILTSSMSNTLTVGGNVLADSFTGSFSGDASGLTNVTASALSIGLGGLTDVTTSSESEGDLLVYNNSTSLWENKKLLSGSYSISGSLTIVDNDATVHGLTVGKGGGDVSTNTALGASALSSNTTGAYNTAVGYRALLDNTTGNNNSAFGDSALENVTFGCYNIGIGSNAGANITSGTWNVNIGANANDACDVEQVVAIGHEALTNNSSGYLVAVGHQALCSNTTGVDNTAVGHHSLFCNTIGSYNTGLGRATLYYNTTGNYNTAIGYGSLALNTTGVNNTAIGYTSLFLNTTGNYNTAVGYGALYDNTAGQFNNAFGDNALANVTTGGNNVGIGYVAGFNTTTGSNNINIGSQANDNANTSNVVAIGYAALTANQADNLVAVGHNALCSNTTGTGNTAVGYQALCGNTTAYENTAFGYSALGSITTGTRNVAIGSSAFGAATTAQRVVAIGRGAARSLNSGDQVVIGYEALASLSSGIRNTAIGYSAGRNSTTSGLNVFIGDSTAQYYSGQASVVIGVEAGRETLGDFNTILGACAFRYASGSNNVVVGYSVATTGTYNNNLIVGHCTDTLLYGNFTSGSLIVNPGSIPVDTNYTLLVSGSGNFTDGLTVTGSLTTTGDLTVEGTITAREFKTELVSASILYQSGSTKFGDTSDDVHSFSGSLRVTGSGDHYIIGGDVGIGNISPTSRLHLKGTNDSAGSYALKVDNSSNNSLFSVENNGDVSIASQGGVSGSLTIGINTSLNYGSRTLTLNSYDDPRIVLQAHAGWSRWNIGGGVNSCLAFYDSGTNRRCKVAIGTSSYPTSLIVSAHNTHQIEFGTNPARAARLGTISPSGNYSGDFYIDAAYGVNLYRRFIFDNNGDFIISGSLVGAGLSLSGSNNNLEGDLTVTGSLTTTGDLTVAGTITAQEFKTELVSASILYQSGSTKFGDTSDDVHSFTGSLNLTSGDSSVSSISINGEGNSYLKIQDSGSRYSLLQRRCDLTEGQLRILQNGATKFIFTDGGCLAVNTATVPTVELDVRGSAVFNGDGGDNDFRVESNNNANMLFVDGGNDRIGIGTNSPLASLHVIGSGTTSSTTSLLVENSNGDDIIKVTDDRDVEFAGGEIKLNKYVNGGKSVEISNVGHNNAVGIRVSSAVPISAKSVLGANGNNPYGASIFAERPTHSTNKNLGLLAQGAYISDTDAVLYNTSSMLHVKGNGTGSTTIGLLVENSDASTSLAVLDDGNVGIGTTSPSSKLHVSGSSDVVLVEGSGSASNTSIFAIDGNNGRLFEVSDDLSDSLFSVNTVAGLPVVEVFADNRVIMGAFNQNDLVISGSQVGIGTATPAYKLDVSGSGNFTDGLTVTGSLTTTGDLTVAGTLTAREFKTELVSASIVYQSGSTKFGDTSDDVHSFTGSLNITGSNIQIDGGRLSFKTSAGDYLNYIENDGGYGLNYFSRSTASHCFLATTNPSCGIQIIPYQVATGKATISPTGGIYGALTNFSELTAGAGTLTLCSDRYNNQSAFILSGSSRNTISSDKFLELRNASTELFTVTNNGNVGIGTTSPSYKLDVAGNIIARNTYPTIYVDHNGTILGGVRADATTKLEFKTLTTAPLSFQVNSSEKMRITDSGNVGIGNNSPNAGLTIGNNGYNGNLAVAESSNNNRVALIGNLEIVNNSTGGTWSGQSIYIPGANRTFGFRGSGALNAADSSAFEFNAVVNNNRTVDYTSFNLQGGYCTNTLAADYTFMKIDGVINQGGINQSGSITGIDYNPNLNYITGSHTAMRLRSGDVLIEDGDLTVAGTLTAREFKTELVSASILYQSGSTKFGDSSDDVHSFSGSLRVTGSGDHYFTDGNVGIGTESPNAGLEVANGGDNSTLRITRNGNSSNYLQLQGGSSGAIYNINTSATQDHIFQTGGYEKMRLTSAGDLGIGTTSPGAKLDVRGSAVFNEDSADVDFRVESNNNANMLFVDGGNDRVGIGTGSPGYVLDVFKAGYFSVDPADSPKVYIRNNTATNSTTGTAELIFQQALISAGGKIVSGREDIYIDSSTRDSFLAFYTSLNAQDTEKLRIISTGNVGIGTTSPSYKLDVSGSGNFTDGLTVTGSLATTGDLTVAGTLTAREFKTELVSASILYQSGSTKFGDTSDDVHSFSGSLRVTGSGDHYFTDGNVGIGTTSPSYKLDVSGTGNFTNGLTATGSVLINGNIVANVSTTKINSPFSSGNYPLSLFDGVYNYNFGFYGKTVGSNRLSIYRNSSTTYFDNSSGDFNFNNLVRSTGLTTSGDVGIGTSSPGAKLDVRGSAVFNEDSADVDFRVESNNNANMLFVDGGNDRVGIGTNTPGSTLGVNGDITATSLCILDGSRSIRQDGNYIRVYGNGGVKLSTWDGGYKDALVVQSTTGNIGIGTTSPSAKLEVAGDTILSGSLYSSRESGSLASGTTLLYSVNTGSYKAGFFDYYAYSGSNGRAGTLMSFYHNNEIVFTDNSTTDIGSTADFEFSMSLDGGNAQLFASASSSDWNVKTTFRTL